MDGKFERVAQHTRIGPSVEGRVRLLDVACISSKRNPVPRVSVARLPPGQPRLLDQRGDQQHLVTSEGMFHLTSIPVASFEPLQHFAGPRPSPHGYHGIEALVEMELRL
jgi:hypothetical protein